MNTLINNNKLNKKKVVFVMGATGTGKSRLSIDLTTHFQGEIINSDKMQVYKGLDIVTNKISDIEKQGVPHHLLGEIDPNFDFTAEEICLQAIACIEKVLNSECLPIIVGGSNSYIEKLVEDPIFMFKSKYVSCFIWLDVALPVLYPFVCMRVDKMIHKGLVDEVCQIFVRDANYTRGIRRSIGVQEMDKFFREEKILHENDESKKKMLLQCAVEEIKLNTCTLICNQIEKIKRLREEKMCSLHHISATTVFKLVGIEGVDEEWKKNVLKPCLEIVEEFLNNDDHKINIEVA